LADLIIINGEEEFLKERAALDEAHNFLTSKIDWFDYSDLDRYLDESQMTPLSGESRVFVIQNSKKIPELPCGDNDVLIVVSNTQLNDAKAKRVHTIKALKTFDNNNEVIKWILVEGRRFNIDLSRVAGALYINNGKRLRKIHSEIQKLSILTKSGDVVSPEIARSVLCFSADLTPKQVIDAVIDGNARLALGYYDKLQEKADETGWIIAYMQFHVLQQLRMEELHQKGVEHNDAAAKLSVHPFVYKKMLEKRLGLWTSESLLNSVSALCDLDLEHKRGNKAARLGLEAEIIRLSEESGNVQRVSGT
jgi:DNA polymerase III delta subunit